MSWQKIWIARWLVCSGQEGIRNHQTTHRNREIILRHVPNSTNQPGTGSKPNLHGPSGSCDEITVLEMLLRCYTAAIHRRSKKPLDEFEQDFPAVDTSREEFSIGCKNLQYLQDPKRREWLCAVMRARSVRACGMFKHQLVKFAREPRS